MLWKGLKQNLLQILINLYLPHISYYTNWIKLNISKPHGEGSVSSPLTFIYCTSVYDLKICPVVCKFGNHLKYSEIFNPQSFIIYCQQQMNVFVSQLYQSFNIEKQKKNAKSEIIKKYPPHGHVMHKRAEHQHPLSQTSRWIGRCE